MISAVVPARLEVVEYRRPSDGALATLLAAAAKGLARMLRRRRGRRLLAHMDDRMLTDIGLVRSDIHRVVRRGRD